MNTIEGRVHPNKSVLRALSKALFSKTGARLISLLGVALWGLAIAIVSVGWDKTWDAIGGALGPIGIVVLFGATGIALLIAVGAAWDW